MIEQFRGKYGFLSNFAEVDVTLDGLTYPSIEHAFISAKSDDPDWKKMCSEDGYTASSLKKVAKTIPLAEDWDLKKLHIMANLLLQKFEREPFLSMLLETGDEEIVEGNYWNDKYWGYCLKTKEGENVLGKMIMFVRGVMQKKYNE